MIQSLETGADDRLAKLKPAPTLASHAAPAQKAHMSSAIALRSRD